MLAPAVPVPRATITLGQPGTWIPASRPRAPLRGGDTGGVLSLTLPF